MNGFLIDVPMIAYKTWSLTVIDKNTGTRMFEEEKKLKNDLRNYEYNRTNPHVR